MLLHNRPGSRRKIQAIIFGFSDKNWPINSVHAPDTCPCPGHPAAPGHHAAATLQVSRHFHVSMRRRPDKARPRSNDLVAGRPRKNFVQALEPRVNPRKPFASPDKLRRPDSNDWTGHPHRPDKWTIPFARTALICFVSARYRSCISEQIDL